MDFSSWRRNAGILELNGNGSIKVVIHIFALLFLACLNLQITAQCHMIFHYFLRICSGPCPDCAPELVNTMAATHLASSDSTNEENNKKAATLMDDPVVFRLFTAFLLSVMVNVFLLSIVIMTCKSSEEFVPSYENEGYEVMMLPQVGKPET